MPTTATLGSRARRGLAALLIVLAWLGSLPLSARPAPAQAILFGTVQRAPGLPVPGTPPLPAPVQGVHVVATNTTSGQRFEAITNARGRFELTVPPGTYRVRGAHSTQSMMVTAGQKRLVNFVIPNP